MVFKVIRQYLKAADRAYIATCVFCSVLSVITLISLGQAAGGFARDAFDGSITGLGSYRNAFVQGVASLLGLVCAIVLSCIDYRSLARIWPVHVVGTWTLVLLTLTHLSIGPLTLGWHPEGTDNYSWIRLGPLSLQPTELAKISFILTFAMHLDNVREHINEPKTLAKLLAHILATVAVVHIQGDDGTAIVFATIGCMMLFAAGLSWKYILSAIALGVTGLSLIIGFFPDVLKGYQVDRIMALIYPDQYPDIARQQLGGMTAIGSGQIFGRGFFTDDHYSVINAQDDFMFSYLAECIGFVGCAVVLGALFFIAIRTLTTGLRSEDHIGTYICTGVFAAIAWQIIINLGMNLSLLPVIGVTLPFFSAGGTSALMMYLSVGLVMSVYMHNKQKLFSD